MAPEGGLGHLDRSVVARWAEVVVVGAGPAGAVAATLLARRGVRVALIHAERGHGPIIGEVLPPAARPTFLELGLGSALEDRAHLRSPGNVSAWGSDVPQMTDFVFSPYGDGLHLDRACFDAHLRTVAAASGARVLSGTWDVRRVSASGRDPGPIRVIVDCTGRSAAVARAAGASIDRLDRLVAVAGVLEPRSESADVDARTFVASVSDGWWYSALLPDGRRVAAFHTDVDLLSRDARLDPRAWHGMLLRAPLVGSLVRSSGAHPPPTLRVLAADSRRLVRPRPTVEPPLPARRGDPELVVAGDAAMAFDPLSSQGILSAIQSAEEAAAEVLASLGGDRDAVAGASAGRADAAGDRWLRYVERLVRAYGDERRWPEAPFWARRHAWFGAVGAMP